MLGLFLRWSKRDLLIDWKMDLNDPTLVGDICMEIVHEKKSVLFMLRLLRALNDIICICSSHLAQGLASFRGWTNSVFLIVSSDVVSS